MFGHKQMRQVPPDVFIHLRSVFSKTSHTDGPSLILAHTIPQSSFYLFHQSSHEVVRYATSECKSHLTSKKKGKNGLCWREYQIKYPVNQFAHCFFFIFCFAGLFKGVTGRFFLHYLFNTLIYTGLWYAMYLHREVVAFFHDSCLILLSREYSFIFFKWYWADMNALFWMMHRCTLCLTMAFICYFIHNIAQPLLEGIFHSLKKITFSHLLTLLSFQMHFFLREIYIYIYYVTPKDNKT